MKDLAKNDPEKCVRLIQKCALHIAGIAAALVIFLLTQYTTKSNVYFETASAFAMLALGFSLVLYITLMLQTPRAITYLKNEQSKNGFYLFGAISVSAGCSLGSFSFLLYAYAGWLAWIFLGAMALSIMYCARYIVNR